MRGVVVPPRPPGQPVRLAEECAGTTSWVPSENVTVCSASPWLCAAYVSVPPSEKAAAVGLSAVIDESGAPVAASV